MNVLRSLDALDEALRGNTSETARWYALQHDRRSPGDPVPDVAAILAAEAERYALLGEEDDLATVARDAVGRIYLALRATDALEHAEAWDRARRLHDDARRGFTDDDRRRAQTRQRRATRDRRRHEARAWRRDHHATVVIRDNTSTSPSLRLARSRARRIVAGTLTPAWGTDETPMPLDGATPADLVEFGRRLHDVAKAEHPTVTPDLVELAATAGYRNELTDSVSPRWRTPSSDERTRDRVRELLDRVVQAIAYWDESCLRDEAREAAATAVLVAEWLDEVLRGAPADLDALDLVHVGATPGRGPPPDQHPENVTVPALVLADACIVMPGAPQGSPIWRPRTRAARRAIAA